MIPLKDDNPTRTFPFVTILLVALNVALFLWEVLLPPEVLQAEVLPVLAVIPERLTGLDPLDPLAWADGGTRLLAAMFLHGGVMHLVGNMVYLWIFGNNIEDSMGHGRFLIFYLVCGLAASFAQVAASPRSPVPMIGASGAISGILGAYLILFPAARVLTLIFVLFFVRVVPFPAVIVLGVWFLMQVINAGSYMPGQLAPGGVAWYAHIGGFVAGMALVAPFRRKRPRYALF
jgi:membrane associated rhomboid family serine protease